MNDVDFKSHTFALTVQQTSESEAEKDTGDVSCFTKRVILAL